MLDYRINTFLDLCDTRSYTRTSKNLNITQPAVTQHIQYLERQYNVELVYYKNKSLSLTAEGEKLYQLALAMKANNKKIEEAMTGLHNHNIKIEFGSTLTIGEYVLPKKITEYLIQYPRTNISMLVDNTTSLLKKLEDGEIHFAIVEGYFDKEKYGHRLLQKSEFIGVCAKNHSFETRELTFEDIIKERLIIREQGSGTRDILETILHENNWEINSFTSYVELGNFNAIKELVKNHMGITFVYKEVVEKDLLDNTLSPLRIRDFDVVREFNIVYLKDDIFRIQYEEFWNFLSET
ncbi:LysR family transcriptional regulator [Anaeromicropila herbilytica]|uniref:LysR family transcriptional regulator n=1 Tax=Anaeromicropila herbilytica TaxID=2785025 RepID=A0A7R7EM92_9FIRM|nr:LysR family transcriptional regulator [Anaeromicropila herbilytica]BCN31348.1 LysR family transcriptional regulator [Anaeromicropila herbilytica]